MARTPGKRALLFVFITVFIDMVGVGIIIPVMPKLIMAVSGEWLADAARWGGWLMVTFAVMQFFFAPIMGNLSDRFGRRPVLVGSLLGYGADFLIMAFAPTLLWLFIGRALSGVFGATYSTANAYIADVTPPEKRAQNFGLLGAAFGLGFIVGPVIGGLLGEIDVRAPFFAAAAIAFVNAVYGYLVLPETLAVENRRPFKLRRANPLGALVQMRRFPLVIGLGGVLFLTQLAHWSLPGTWAYFAQARFGWSELSIGLSLAFVGVMYALVMGGVTRVAIPKIGEARAVIFGLLISVAALLGYAFSTQGWMIYAWITAGSLGAIMTPALQGILANQVPASQQGELQGALTSLQSLTAILGPPLMTQAFAYFNAEAAPFHLPGAAFVLAAGLTLLALVPFWLTMRRAKTAAA